MVGLGFGGWIAAEMATMAPAAFRRLVLVGAMGIKPERGEIADQALVSYIDYVRLGFADQKKFDAIYGAEPPTPTLEQWDLNREMSFRVAWKPYMYNASLPHLLGGVTTPTLVVWGVTTAWCRSSAASATPRRCRTRVWRSSTTPDTSWRWSNRTQLVSPDRRLLMHLMYFTEQPMSAYPTSRRAAISAPPR